MNTPFMDKNRDGRHGIGANGWLKQRLAQILMRSSCTTTTTTTTNSSTAFVSLAKTNAASHQEPPSPPSPPFCNPCGVHPRPKLDGGRRPFRRRGATLVNISIDCSSGLRSVHSDAPLLPSSLPLKDAKKSRGRSKPRFPPTSRRHYSSSAGRTRRATRTAALYSCSPSTKTDDELAPFSSDEESGEEAETRTLFSSLSFSSDSTSEFYNNSSSTRKIHSNTPRRRLPRRALTRTAKSTDAFRPLVSMEKAVKSEKDGVVGAAAGMAVVKRSSNPYADFRSSMVEMVVERRICGVGEMEKLLGSYLSLNSPRHHPAILAAFEDVWKAILGDE